MAHADVAAALGDAAAKARGGGAAAAAEICSAAVSARARALEARRRLGRAIWDSLKDVEKGYLQCTSKLEELDDTVYTDKVKQLHTQYTSIWQKRKENLYRLSEK